MERAIELAYHSFLRHQKLGYQAEQADLINKEELEEIGKTLKVFDLYKAEKSELPNSSELGSLLEPLPPKSEAADKMKPSLEEMEDAMERELAMEAAAGLEEECPQGEGHQEAEQQGGGVADDIQSNAAIRIQSIHRGNAARKQQKERT